MTASKAIGPDLNPDMFHDFSNLKYLCISNNELLTKITRDSFKSLKNVEIVELVHCGIVEIEPQAFKSLEKLKSLGLSLNKLTRFSFKDIPANLERLSLSHNKIESIDTEDLPINMKLTVLNLSGNMIKSLPGDSFSSLIALRELNLSKSQLSDVSCGAFNGLVNLRELDLNLTGLKVIQAGLFLATPNLRKLILGATKLERVEPDAFSHLRGRLLILLDEYRSSFDLLKLLEKESLFELKFFEYFLCPI